MTEIASLFLPPRKRTIAFLGHSFQAASFGAGGLLYTTAYPGWLSVLARDSVIIKHALNFAVAGQTSTQIIARLPDVIAAAPGVCVLDLITNDTALAWTETRDNIITAVMTLQSVGILPIVMLWTGRGSTTTAQYRKAMRINEWVRSTYLGLNSVFIVDPGELFTDPVTGLPRSGYDQGDSLHPSNNGSYYFVQPLLRLLRYLFPEPPAIISNTLDVYDATDNPTGNRLPGGGMMAGTGGAKGGSAAGVVADGMTLTDANAGGATVTGSKGTMSDGRPCQIITLSGTYSGNGRYAEFTTSANLASSFAAGQAVEAMVDLGLSVGQTGLCGVTVLGNVLTGGGNIFPSAGGGSASYGMPNVAIAGRLKTDRDSAIIPATPTFVSFAVRIGMVNAGGSTPVSAEIKIASASLKGF